MPPKCPALRAPDFGKSGANGLDGLGQDSGDGVDASDTGAVHDFGNGRFTGQHVVHDIAWVRLSLAIVHIAPEVAFLQPNAACKGHHHDMVRAAAARCSKQPAGWKYGGQCSTPGNSQSAFLEEIPSFHGLNNASIQRSARRMSTPIPE